MRHWNRLYRKHVAGNHQAQAPAGNSAAWATQNSCYTALDVPGEWHATEVGSHCTVTKQNHNPATDPLRWSDLEHLAHTRSPRHAAPFQPVRHRSGSLTPHYPPGTPGKPPNHR